VVVAEIEARGDACTAVPSNMLAAKRERFLIICVLHRHGRLRRVGRDMPIRPRNEWMMVAVSGRSICHLSRRYNRCAVESNTCDQAMICGLFQRFRHFQPMK
jgi:hypothetical protein